MSERTDPQGERSPPATNRPRRPSTLLGRLARAVREQNWFAVALELVIVVLGVVIGFQVTAWGQARADRAKEETYLRQLVVDLAETERVVADTDVRLAAATRATGELLRAFRSPEPPPRDSLLRWLHEFRQLRVALPVMGTVEALVSTGDLALIQSDSLRSTITAYAQTMGTTTRSQDQWTERERDARSALYALVDMNEVDTEVLPVATLDSLTRADPIRGIHVGEQRARYPVSVEAVLSDRAVYAGVEAVSIAKRNAQDYREEMLAETRTLRAQVEAELDR